MWAAGASLRRKEETGASDTARVKAKSWEHTRRDLKKQ